MGHAGKIVDALRGQYLGAAALIVALTGTAYAADLIGPKDIRKNAVRSKHVKADALTGSDVDEATLDKDALPAGPQGVPGGTGPAGLDGSPDTAAQVLAKLVTVDGTGSSLNADQLDGLGSPSYLGPRAYGRVSQTGAESRSKGVIDVTAVAGDVFCIELSGLNPSTSPMIVSPDLSGSGTDDPTDQFSIVQWDSIPDTCPSTEFEVETFLYNGDPLDDNDGSGTTGGDAMTADTQPFTFVVP